MKYELTKAMSKFLRMHNVRTTRENDGYEIEKPGIRTLGLIDYLRNVGKVNIKILGSKDE